MSPEAREQLEMIWPTGAASAPPPAPFPSGYSLRTYRPGDEPGFAYLMERAGFGEWGPERIEAAKRDILPGGWFFVVHGGCGAIVSTAQADHRPAPRHPFGGELGWVATDPDHRGTGLAEAVSAAAVRRLLAAGYDRIYLRTDDVRIAAVRLYVRMGFVPYLFSDDMRGRWRALAEGLGFPYTPERWPV